MFILMGMLLVTSCEKEMADQTGESAEQLMAGRLSGTWANPTDIVTPAEVPAEIFGEMRLVFTMDGVGNPAEFLGQGCPIVFSAMKSSWSVSGAEDAALVKLTGTAPVDEFQARVDANNLTLSFYMGWENLETGETGEGDFQVTLSRQ